MARKSSEQSPDGMESVTVAEIEAERADDVPEETGRIEEINHSIEYKTSNNTSETVEMKGEVNTPDERTQKNGAEPDGSETLARSSKRPAARKRTKPAEPASPAAGTSDTPEPKRSAPRQRKQAAEAVALAAEASEAPKPKKRAASARKKPVEPASPAKAVPTEANATEPAMSLETTAEEAQEPETTGEERPAAQEELPAASAEPPTAAEEPRATEEAPAAQDGVEEIVAVIETIRVVEEEASSPAAIIEKEPAIPIQVQETVNAPASERRHLVKSAALVSIGNLGSSLMGMVRQVVVASLGAPIGGPFNAALTPANNFFQLLINGSVSGALVPTFNDYAAPEKREEMRRVVFTVVNLILLIALVASIGYTLIAPWFINIFVQGYDHQADKLLTLQYSQIIFFSLVALGPFAVLLSALFALKEFGWPAFATAAYHVGIILGAIVLSFFGSTFLGKMALPAGVLLGALGEIALLLPGIRRQRFAYMFVLDLKHPALRRIIKLYFPILVSYVFTTALVFLDVHLWTLAGDGHQGTANTLAQATATALLQFPVGLVAMALGFAVLPTLSEHAREGNNERFKATLLLGFRVGLLLMIPAMVGMWVLRLPIVYLLFAHHNNSLANAGLSALALQNYVYQLPFVAIDQLLIAAFYARKNTITPVVVGIVCIGFYLLVALPFFQSIGIAALAFANTVQNSMHAVILLILLRRAMGSLHVRTTIPAILKICVASAVMGVVAWGAMTLLGHISLFSLDHLLGQFLTVVVAGGLAVAVYIGGILLLKVEEINLVKGAVLAKLGKR
jgi:putative peptidoglycan lipid II flippase